VQRDVSWFDDWYVIDKIGSGLFGIGEPKYHQINWNYLIVGHDRALLFDTGPGLRDITPVVTSLTDKPVTALLSHLHFDHTGNFHRFTSRALADLPILRACETGGLFIAPEQMFLGSYENISWVPVSIRRWWPIGHRIDLGGRSLEIIATPGHSPDSISLFDRVHNILLAADFLYPGDLYAQIPGASLPDYLATAETLLHGFPADMMIFGAHGMEHGEDAPEAPVLSWHDLVDLTSTLGAIRDNSLPPACQHPDRYVINEVLALLAGPQSYGSWRPGQGG
jgi:glyoxylase-like metal-dependent hydrolase (beta-lactamase superfamily II)